MSFIRRHYYDLVNGDTVYSYRMEDAINYRPVKEDFVFYPALAGRTLSDTGVLEWAEPAAEIEDGFARAYSVTVADGQPVFDFVGPAASETLSPDPAEMQEALETLGVNTQGGNV